MPAWRLRERGVGVGQAASAVEIVKRFEPLDRVTFDARTQAVANDLVQIDEQLGAQHPIDFFLAGRIAAHQALQRRRLVRRVVVDVQIGKSRPSLHDEIDKLLEAVLFVRAENAQLCWYVSAPLPSLNR